MNINVDQEQQGARFKRIHIIDFIIFMGDLFHATMARLFFLAPLHFRIESAFSGFNHLFLWWWWRCSRHRGHVTRLHFSFFVSAASVSRSLFQPEMYQAVNNGLECIKCASIIANERYMQTKNSIFVWIENTVNKSLCLFSLSLEQQRQQQKRNEHGYCSRMTLSFIFRWVCVHRLNLLE